MPTITAKVSDELLAYIDLVSGGNRSEYLRRWALLNKSDFG